MKLFSVLSLPLVMLTPLQCSEKVRCDDVVAEARAVGWPEKQLPTVRRIAYRESRCSATVRSKTHDSGLMQINDIWLRDRRLKRDWPGLAPKDLFNSRTNLAVALWIYHQSGWGPWRL